MSATLPYGKPDTQFGVVTEILPDGGVTLTVPDNFLTAMFANLFRGRRRHGLKSIQNAASLLQETLAGNRAVRAVLTLQTRGFEFVEPNREQLRPTYYRLDEIGELRCNRYSNGLYVTIRGRDSFDLLTDVRPKVVQYVGQALEDAMSRLRPVPLPVKDSS